MGFFKNRRVYLLTTVAYMGSLLFGYGTEHMLGAGKKQDTDEVQILV
jgi:hypothetical protein